MTTCTRICASIVAMAVGVTLTGCVIVPLNPDGAPAYPVTAVQPAVVPPPPTSSTELGPAVLQRDLDRPHMTADRLRPAVALACPIHACLDPSRLMQLQPYRQQLATTPSRAHLLGACEGDRAFPCASGPGRLCRRSRCPAQRDRSDHLQSGTLSRCKRRLGPQHACIQGQSSPQRNLENLAYSCAFAHSRPRWRA